MTIFRDSTDEAIDEISINMKSSIKRALGITPSQYEILARAVKELYTAAYWTSKGQKSETEEVRLWENVRKAAGIRKGTATKLGVGKIV